MNRKLAKEIDQTYKRINEGIDFFDRIHEKLSSAPTQSLRDKFEAELKKEIKKLQRCRDSIKQWLSGTEVKDKAELLKYRKMVETKMEQFKTVEKESKMKAYSKEALAKKSRDTKKKKLDRRELECCQRIEDWVVTLQEQVESNDENIKEVQRSKKPDLEEIERLEEINKKHRGYIENLKETLRLLKNGVIEVSDVELVSEDLEYYIEDHANPDFIENEYLFDGIMEKKEGNNEDEDEDDELLEIPEVEESQSDFEESPQTQLRINDILRSDEQKEEDAKKEKEKADSKIDKKDRRKSEEKKTKQKKVVPAPQPAIPPQPVVSYRDVIAAADDAADTTPTSTSVSKAQGADPLSKSPTLQMQNVTSNVYPYQQLNTSTGDVPGFQKAPSQLQQPVSDTQHQLPHTKDSTFNHRLLSRSIPVEDRLICSLRTLPSDIDTEFPDVHNPRHPADTPDFFPQFRHPRFNSSEFFGKILSIDSLFFAFYFQPGQLQQELAAQELKNKDWKFHSKYLAWFKCHQQAEKNAEYESGTYIYFDYDKEWTPRIKNQFKFVYGEAFTGKVEDGYN